MRSGDACPHRKCFDPYIQNYQSTIHLFISFRSGINWRYERQSIFINGWEYNIRWFGDKGENNFPWSPPLDSHMRYPNLHTPNFNTLSNPIVERTLDLRVKSNLNHLKYENKRGKGGEFLFENLCFLARRPSIWVVVEYIAAQECLMQLRSVYQAAQRASVVASENIMESVLLIYYWDRKNILTQCTSCYPL